VFYSLMAGSNHTCGVETGTGKAWCWGYGVFGQLGDGYERNASEPVTVLGDKVFASLAAGTGHTCGVEASTGAAWCWGWNGQGQLGVGKIGSSGDSVFPVRVMGEIGFSSVVAGWTQTCGVEAGAGSAWCWGGNYAGQLGDGSDRDMSVAPAAVTGGRVFSSLAGRGSHTCGIETGTGKAWCWGENNRGELGDGTVDQGPQYGKSSPVTVTGGRVFTSLVAGESHTCGVEAGTGKAWCWGANTQGQLGDGTVDHASPYGKSSPVMVTGGIVFSSLVAGYAHTCGVEAGTNAVWCWGGNYAGQLGDGTTADRTAPVAVIRVN